MINIPQISAERQFEILKKKLDKRAKYTVLTSSSNPKHEENRLVAYDLCKESFQFFCDNFVWIQDPEAEKAEDKEIQFLLYDYQEKSAEAIIKAVTNGYDIPIEKTRKMGLSWLLVAIFVWGWHFREWELLVGSQKAENVDTRGNIKSLLEKARFITSRTPEWIIPKLKDKLHDKSMLLLNPLHGATLAGESNNTNFGRSDRRKAILFDEFSSWEQTDKAAWQSCSSTTKCRIPLSTPNTRGTNCHYYNVIQDAKKKERPYLRLHWTLNPIFAKGLYYDELGRPRSPWYDEEVARSSSLQEVSQELDIDYEASMGGKVFPDFTVEDNVVEGLEYDPNLPMYYAWDFGLDTTAILFIQVDVRNNIHYIIDEYQNSGETKEGSDIYHYIDVVDSKGYKAGIHYGDPHSGENRSLAARGDSNANILRRQGFIFRSQRAKIHSRVGAGRNLIKNTKVSDKCTMATEMFLSWQLRKPKTGQITSGIPDHSEYSHIGEAWTYHAYNYANRARKKPAPKKQYSMSLSGVV